MFKTKEIVLFGAFLFGSVSHASLIVVDPGQFDPGTDISNAFTGVSLSNITGGYPPGTSLTRMPIYTVECDGCSGDLAGQSVFGHGPLSFGWEVPASIFEYSDMAANYYEENYTFTYEFLAGRWNAMQIDFHQPTSYVQLIGGGASNGNFFMFDVWNTEGQRLARCFSATENTECGATPIGGDTDPSKAQWAFSFSTLDADIGFITAGGWAGGQHVQSFAFSQIPEPSALVLLALGLTGIAVSRAASRRRMPG